jgi:hypothetical protein
MLAASASPVPGFGPADQGAGLFDIAAAAAQPAPHGVQKFPRASAGGGWRGMRPIGVELTADPSMSRWTMSRWTMSRWTMSRWTMSRWTGDAWASVDAAPAPAPIPATNAG